MYKCVYRVNGVQICLRSQWCKNVYTESMVQMRSASAGWFIVLMCILALLLIILIIACIIIRSRGEQYPGEGFSTLRCNMLYFVPLQLFYSYSYIFFLHFLLFSTVTFTFFTFVYSYIYISTFDIFTYSYLCTVTVLLHNLISHLIHT